MWAHIPWYSILCDISVYSSHPHMESLEENSLNFKLSPLKTGPVCAGLHVGSTMSALLQTDFPGRWMKPWQYLKALYIAGGPLLAPSLTSHWPSQAHASLSSLTSSCRSCVPATHLCNLWRVLSLCRLTSVLSLWRLFHLPPDPSNSTLLSSFLVFLHLSAPASFLVSLVVDLVFNGWVITLAPGVISSVR